MDQVGLIGQFGGGGGVLTAWIAVRRRMTIYRRIPAMPG